MAAPNFETLYQFTDYMLSASYQILSGSGLNAYEHGHTENARTPAVAVDVNLGSPIGHVHITGSSGIYDAFNGTLNAEVATNRTANGNQHSLYVAKTYLALSNVDSFNDILPYHGIAIIRPNGSAVRVQNQENIDISAISFDFVIFIRSDAWPS